MAISTMRNHCSKESVQSSAQPVERAETLVVNRFRRSPYLPLRHINCRLDNGVLSLRGRVPTYFLKQLAQTIGGSLEGVRRIVNELHVDFPEKF